MSSPLPLSKKIREAGHRCQYLVPGKNKKVPDAHLPAKQMDGYAGAAMRPNRAEKKRCTVSKTTEFRRERDSPPRSSRRGLVPPAPGGTGNPRGDSFARCVFGERGIRTPVPLAQDPVFKTGAIGHSAISPSASRGTVARWRRRCQAANPFSPQKTQRSTEEQPRAVSHKGSKTRRKNPGPTTDEHGWTRMNNRSDQRGVNSLRSFSGRSPHG